MSELLEIEQIIGRIRLKESKYTSRIIDIDILLIDDMLIDTKDLIVPHPEISNRRFVIEPLVEISPNLINPINRILFRELLNNFSKKQMVKKKEIFLKNPSSKSPILNYNYVAVEGNIGSGKTSLSNQISNDFDSKLILERFLDNPFLANFYKNPKEYAFKLEMSFLADRYQQTKEDLSQLNIFEKIIIADYDIHKSLIFSKVNLSIDEFNLYRKLFYSLHSNITKPDLIIYLNQTIDNLKKNIKKRGRDYEMSIDGNYLKKINESYFDFFKSRPDLNVKFIDVSEMDFVNNRLDYLSLLNCLD
jgi:deoxyadenosine/deoxycytidine kinase